MSPWVYLNHKDITPSQIYSTHKYIPIQNTTRNIITKNWIFYHNIQKIRTKNILCWNPFMYLGVSVTGKYDTNVFLVNFFFMQIISGTVIS